MKVVVLGGYGVFGSLLSELLCRDGHELWIVGRDQGKAEAVATRLSCRALAVDLRREPDRIFEPKPDVVIDAAGPFQAYDGDPWAIPRLCLAHGVNYLDLSDASDFTAGIGKLDAEAQVRGCGLLSGASSVPGLSSSVVQALAAGLDEIHVIDTAILPGNRAPRGASVIASIVGGVGRTTQVWRGGCWRTSRGWTEPRSYRLADDLVRTAYTVDVPDTRLFPAAFKARSVMFRAGMELTVMNRALSALAAFRNIRDASFPGWALVALRWLSNALRGFGTDRGGMQVCVTGQTADGPVEKIWTLIAEAGQGPFVPGVMARALLRRAGRIAHGARPCLAEVSLEEIERAMSDLSITTGTTEAPNPTLFQSALGDRRKLLPRAVQALHDVHDVESFSGKAEITRGTSMLARLAAWFFRFPNAGKDVPVTVTKTRTSQGEIWQRDFGGRVFGSRCTPSTLPHHFRERFSGFNYELELPVADGEIHLPVRRGWFLGVPLPKFMLPASMSREFAVGGVFHFDVALHAPMGGGLIVRYRGSLVPDREAGVGRGIRPPP